MHKHCRSCFILSPFLPSDKDTKDKEITLKTQNLVWQPCLQGFTSRLKCWVVTPRQSILMSDGHDISDKKNARGDFPRRLRRFILSWQIAICVRNCTRFFFSSFSLVDLVCVVTDIKDAADARDFSRMNVNRKKDEKHAIGINISGRFFYSTTLRNTRS